MFVKPAFKLSHMGRRSGGVIMLVRKKLMTVIKNIKVDFDNVLLVRKCFWCGQRCVSYLLLCMPPTFLILQRQSLQVQFTVGGGMYYVRK